MCADAPRRPDFPVAFAAGAPDEADICACLVDSQDSRRILGEVLPRYAATPQGDFAPEIVGDGGDPDLQPGLGETEPTCLPQAVGALPGAEHLLDPVTHAANVGVAHLEAGASSRLR